MEVEMDLDEDKPGTAWLPAISLGYVGPDYFTLKCKSSGSSGMEGDAKLRVHIKRIRPRPPLVEDKNFESLEKVDAFHGSSWSVGVITRFLGGQRYTVTFRHERKEMDFNHAELRPHLDWIDGKWVPNSKGVKFASGYDEQSRPACNKGKTVKIISSDESSNSLNESLCSSKWDDTEKGICLAHKQGNQKESSPPVQKSTYFESLNKDNVNHTSNGDNSAEVVSTKDHESNMQQEVGEIENHATISADEREKLLESRFSVLWPGKRKRKRLSGAKLQNHQSSDTAKEDSVLEAAYKESLEPDNAIEEGMLVEPQEVMDSHVENSSLLLIECNTNSGISIETNGRGKNPKLQAANLQTAVAAGNKISDDVVTIGYCTTEKFKRLATTCSKLTDAQAHVYQLSGNVSSDDQALSMHVEETNCLTNVGVFGNVEPTDMRDLPFVKSSPIWQFLESTEIFTKLPQKPHFRPLLNSEERKREGIAIGHMVNYANLIDKIYRLQENDPTEPIESIVTALAELEELGFDVKVLWDRLNEMQKTKAELEKLKDRSRAVEREIKECTDEMTKCDGEIAEIDNEIEKLKTQWAALMSESAGKQSKITKLVSEAAVINASLSGAQERLRNIVIIPR